MDITPKKQDSKFSINERYDFLFATALSKPVRWLLVLPVAFCAMGAIQFLGSALIKLLCNLFGDGEAVAVLLNSILCTIKYMLFIIAADNGMLCFGNGYRCNFCLCENAGRLCHQYTAKAECRRIEVCNYIIRLLIYHNEKEYFSYPFLSSSYSVFCSSTNRWTTLSQCQCTTFWSTQCH